MRLILNIKIIAIALLLSATCKASQVNLPTDEKLISFLNALFDNNAKFSESIDPEFFSKFRDSQTPDLTIIKCSDSRVSMDAFDYTPKNDVFTIRNIGNQMVTSEGSVDYGVKVLKTPYLMIAGHSGCGAVKAAKKGKKTNIAAVDKELSTIKLNTNQTINEAILENIHNQVELARKKYKTMVDSGELTILGVVYDFKNDFGLGKGKVILVNVNGIKNKDLINQTYTPKVKTLQAM
jgi:carbonic anhydrase